VKSGFRRLIAAHRRTITLLLLGALLIFLYAIVAKYNSLFASPPVGRPSILHLSARETSSALWKLLLLFPACILIAAGLSATGRSLRLSRIFALKALPLVLTLASMAVIAVSIILVFRATEITDDEPTYLYQAKTYLAGRLYNPPPPVPEVFGNTFILQLPDKMVGKYSFAHPLILALGLLLGSPYVVTLLMSALLIPLVIGIGNRLYGDRTVALLSGILLAISPFFYGVSSTLLSHTTSAFFLAAFFYLTLGWLEGKRTGILRGLAAGAAFGIALNVRSLTALAFALPLAGLVLLRMRERKVRPDGWLAGLFCGAAALGAATLAYNVIITGNPLTFPFILSDPNDRPGFSTGYIQPIWQIFENPAQNLARLNLLSFGMPAGLLFATLMLFRTDLSAGDLLCFLTLAAIGLVYLAFWFPGIGDVGPVYYYEMMIPLTLLTARGILWLRDEVASRFPTHRSFVSWYCLMSFLCSFWIVYPEQTLYLSNLTRRVRIPYEEIRSRNIHHAVVFLHNIPPRGWVFGYRNNDPDFTNDVILCQASRIHAEEVMKAFPGRDYYLLAFPEGVGAARLVKIGSP
jgi:Dolichyl-phosphate-mannose-protein mannosyltransferase